MTDQFSSVELPVSVVTVTDGTSQTLEYLRIEDGKLKFYGEVEESAEKFFDYLRPMMDEYIKEEVRKMGNLKYLEMKYEENLDEKG